MNLPVLCAENVSFRYRKNLPYVVNDWTHEFFAGTLTAMTGPSGCGKSTRLYLLALMSQISSGSINLFGQRVDSLPEAERAAIRAQHFGFVFQDALLDPTRSVLENITEPKVLFADEPTGNLDPESSATVFSTLREAADQGSCVILVTHDPELAKQADAHLALPRAGGSHEQ